MPRAGLCAWKAAAHRALPAAAMGAARAEDTSGSRLVLLWSPEPDTRRSLRSASSAAQELLTPLTPPTARRLEARSQPWTAEANQKQQWAKEPAGLFFLRKEEAEVTLGTGGGNHGAAGEGRSCRCRRCREPRR